MEKNNSTSPLVSEASRNTEGQGINRRKLKEWDETTPIFPFIGIFPPCCPAATCLL